MGKNRKNWLVGKPNIGDKKLFSRYVDRLLDNAQLTNNGPLVQEFEQKLQDYLGVKNCILMSNGTVALELAIRALGLEGEVIIPSMTFIATAHALQWQRIHPIFVDIDRNTLTIDPVSVESWITPKTTGILGVHLYGRSCDIDKLQDIADRYQLKLLFDAAHAFGVTKEGIHIGNFGNCEVFSFHATKVLNSFEGGAVTTNDDALANKLRLMRNFGFSGEDQVSYIGINGKMTEICAAMGLANLQNLDHFILVNERNYKFYRTGLQEVQGISIIDYDQREKNNYHYMVLQIEESIYGKTRDELKSYLEDHGIMARRYFYPGCHRMEPYRSLYPHTAEMLPVTEKFNQQVLVLPNGLQLDEAEVVWICKLIRDFGLHE